MSKILEFNSLGGPEVLEFKNFNLDRELEPDEVDNKFGSPIFIFFVAPISILRVLS